MTTFAGKGNWMTTEEQVKQRSNGCCELCDSKNELEFYAIAPMGGKYPNDTLMVCKICADQIEKRDDMDVAHWSCLNGSVWSEVVGVQVMAWRMLNRLKSETWALDLLEQMYLDDDAVEWAKKTGDHLEQAVHVDCNGAILRTGDTVTLIKSLDVKGSSINAKIGTVVKNIRLVADNADQIEGKIEGQQIVILTKYTRKS